MTDRISRDRHLDRLTPSVTPAKRKAEPVSNPSIQGTKGMPEFIERRKKDSMGIDPAQAQKIDITAPQSINHSSSKNSYEVTKKFRSQNLNKSLQLLAAKENERRRPLVIVQTTELLSEKIDEKFHVGCMFLKDHLEKFNSKHISFDSKNLYTNENIKIGIFFGKKNQQYREIMGKSLKEIDPKGVLFHSILQVNEKLTYRPDILCSIALISASLKAGHFGPTSVEDAKHPLSILSPKDKQDALGFALVASSRAPFYELAETLLSWGAKADAASDDDGSIPLEIALDDQNLQLAKLLIKHGADPDLELVSGMTCRETAQDQDLVEFQNLFQSSPKCSG